jgi:hypothetical protein
MPTITKSKRPVKRRQRPDNMADWSDDELIEDARQRAEFKKVVAQELAAGNISEQERRYEVRLRKRK